MLKLKEILKTAGAWLFLLITSLLMIFYAPIYMRKRSRKESIKNMNTDRVKHTEEVQNAEQQWLDDSKAIDKARSEN